MNRCVCAITGTPAEPVQVQVLVKIIVFVRRSRPICWRCSESYMMKGKSSAFMLAAPEC